MRIFKTLLVGLLIAWGLLALLARAATPLLDSYRGELASLLGERLGKPVTIGDLEASWYGITPLLRLHDVHLGKPDEALRIDHATLDFGARELLSGEWLEALRLTVVGMQLTLVREPSGELHLEGVGETSTDTTDDSPVTLSLPSHIRLVDTRVSWIDRKTGRPPLTLDQVDVQLDRDGDLLELGARFETGSGIATLHARVHGFLATTSWHGETYLRIEDLDAAESLSAYLPPVYGLDSFDLRAEVWTDWRDAAPAHSQGHLRVGDLTLNPQTEGAEPFALAHAAAGFSVEHETDRLRIGVEDLQLQLDEHPWPKTDLALSIDTADDGTRRLAMDADYLRIDDIARILQVRPPYAELIEPLGALKPRGELHDLRIRADVRDGNVDWRTQALITDLAVEPWGKMPGVQRIDGQLHAQSGHLVLHLDSENSVVRFSELFRGPLLARRLQGRIDLLNDRDGWRLLSDRLMAETPDIQTRTRLAITQRPQQALFIDLQTDFNDGNAANAHRYYPTAIMGKPLVRWLDRSIVSGQVVSGSALFHGPVDDFPFEQSRNGKFQVLFHTKGLAVDYLEGWPGIEQLAARVEFHGNQLDIRSGSAHIYDSQIDQFTGRIARLNPISPLRVGGRVKGPLRDTLRLLAEDGLRERFGYFATLMRATGSSELALDFSLPLGSTDGDYALDGRLDLRGAGLTLPQWDIALDNIVGRLKFDLDGISGSAIKARALGTPVTVNVIPVSGGITRVRTRGRVDIDRVRRRLPQIPRDLADGSAQVIVDVDVPGDPAGPGSTTQLAVNSELDGIRIDLPAPFGKPHAGSRTLRASIPLGARAAAGSLSYGGLLSARFADNGERIDLTLGGGEARPGSARGIRIDGRISELDLLDWSKALGRLLPSGDGSALPVSLDLHTGRLQAGLLEIEDIHLAAARQTVGWRGKVDAEHLAGDFSTAEPLTSAPVQIDLSHLRLRLPVGEDNPQGADPPDPNTGPDPSSLPSLNLSIDELKVNDAELGRLELQTQRVAGGQRVIRLNLDQGMLQIDSAGHWSQVDEQYHTWLAGHAETESLGDLLVALGYSRQIEGAKTKVEFQTAWPGNPAQFHRKSLQGSLKLDIDQGRMIELDPGVTRVFGLLNLNALTRRLRLDFSDFLEKGYSFDSINGNFAFDAGIATTDNLSVIGPSGRIDLDGTANLVARTSDQHVTVTPKLDATLPIAGTIAGGPLAGIAVLVAQKALTKQVDAINRFEYQLRGPWADLQIEQLNSGGTLSKLLRPFSKGAGDSADKDNDAPRVVPDSVLDPDTVTPEELSALPPTSAGTRMPGGTESTAAGSADSLSGIDPSAAEPAPDSGQTSEAKASRNPLRRLLDFLKDSKPHGADLPGSSE